MPISTHPSGDEQTPPDCEPATPKPPPTMPTMIDHATTPAAPPPPPPLEWSAHDRGPGNAPTCYDVQFGQYTPTAGMLRIEFQRGNPARDGANGVTNEVLMEVVADRLRAFQAGPFACRENALALTKIEEALHWLDARMSERTARGVEGTPTA